MTKKPACECPLAGYCNRHNMEKTPHFHALCQNNNKYFEMWEECRGPGQSFVECNDNKEQRNKENHNRNVKVKKTVAESKDEVALPGLFQQAKNLAGSVSKHVLTGMHNVTEEEFQERLSICNGCEFKIHESNRCGKCGCFLDAKAKMKSSSCPINKW